MVETSATTHGVFLKRAMCWRGLARVDNTQAGSGFFCGIGKLPRQPVSIRK